MDRCISIGHSESLLLPEKKKNKKTEKKGQGRRRKKIRESEHREVVQ